MQINIPLPVVWIVGIWGGIFLILKLLEASQYRNMLYRFLERNNLEISIGHIKWQTDYFNQIIIKSVRGSRLKLQFFSVWFAVGVIVSLILSVVSILLLFYNMYSMINFQEGDQPIMTPLVPGVNVPVSQIPYLFLSLLISAIFHELGHAMAAANIRKDFSSVGMFIFAIFPGAFVNFVDEFEDLNPIQKLKIYCAGAWHNAIIVLIAVLFTLSISFWMSPLYSYGDGVSVLAVDENSPIYSHIKNHDIITHINECPIHDTNDWVQCLTNLIEPDYVEPGYCAPDLAIDMALKESQECCEPDYMGSLQCFSIEKKHEFMGNQKVCMSARQILTQSRCQNSVCEEGTCLYPELSENDFLMKIIKSDGTFVVFLGHPSLLYSYLLVVDYSPKWEILKHFNFHFHTENFLYYITSISAALGILNMAPVFMLDGQWTFVALCDLLFPKATYQDRHIWSQYILWIGSAFFISNLVLSTIMILL